MREAGPGQEASRQSRVAAADALDLAQERGVFEATTAYRFRPLNLTPQGEVRPVLGCAVSAGFFDVLHTRPALGRAFLAGEEEPGRDDVAVVSHAFWQRLGADPGLLGRTLLLDGRSYTVVGIMPRDFDYPVPVELWVPLALGPGDRTDRVRKSVYMLGRLRPEVSLAEARSVLQSVGRRLEQQHPETSAGRQIVLLRLREELYQYTLPVFLMLQAAAGFLLFLACANLTNLLFARLIGRQRELAIRTALGRAAAGCSGCCSRSRPRSPCWPGAVAAAVSVWTVDLIRDEHLRRVHEVDPRMGPDPGRRHRARLHARPGRAPGDRASACVARCTAPTST